MESKIVDSKVYSLKELFSSKFDVDFYQREYVWNRKQTGYCSMVLLSRGRLYSRPAWTDCLTMNMESFLTGPCVLSLKLWTKLTFSLLRQ